MYQIINYEVEDLRKLFIHLNKTEVYKPVFFDNDIPMHLTESEKINGEIFKEKAIQIVTNNYGKIKLKISASNMGRVKYDNKVITQRLIDGKEDYLVVDIEENNKKYEIFVYRIVAQVWLSRIDDNNSQMHVHHITNNGFDNRPSNLMWVSKEEHDIIELGLRRKKDV